MTTRHNRNAIAGKNVETLFMNSVGDNPIVIKKLKKAFGITGDYRAAMTTGVQGNKCDVKIGFTSGRNIDANIKAYKPKVMFNQATRMSVDNFATRFGLDKKQTDLLRDLVLAKTAKTNSPLFPL